MLWNGKITLHSLSIANSIPTDYKNVPFIQKTCLNSRHLNNQPRSSVAEHVVRPPYYSSWQLQPWLLCFSLFSLNLVKIFPKSITLELKKIQVVCCLFIPQEKRFSCREDIMVNFTLIVRYRPLISIEMYFIVSCCSNIINFFIFAIIAAWSFNIWLLWSGWRQGGGRWLSFDNAWSILVQCHFEGESN